MLSRVAESLYWMSRNVERAESLARILDVNYNRTVDRNAAGRERAARDEVRERFVDRSVGRAPQFRIGENVLR